MKVRERNGTMSFNGHFVLWFRNLSDKPRNGLIGSLFLIMICGQKYEKHEDGVFRVYWQKTTSC